MNMNKFAKCGSRTLKVVVHDLVGSQQNDVHISVSWYDKLT